MRQFPRILTVLFAAVLLLCACGQSGGSQGGSKGTTWQEQYDLGLRYLSEGNYQEAILAFTAAIEIDPKQAPAYVGRGDAYVLSGETEDNLTAARLDYEKAIELDELLAEAYLGLADVYIRQGDYDKALEILRQGLEKIGENQDLEDRIAGLSQSPNSANNPNREGTPAESNGTLQLSNVTYTYEPGGNLANEYEDGMGGMVLSYTVDGPENVRYVWLSFFGETSFDAEGIAGMTASMTEIWRTANEDYFQTPPFDSGSGFPVRENDRGKTYYVMLVGLDENKALAAYATVAVQVPG